MLGLDRAPELGGRGRGLAGIITSRADGWPQASVALGLRAAGGTREPDTGKHGDWAHYAEQRIMPSRDRKPLRNTGSGLLKSA